MNILVCFKAVPDLESLTGSDWQPDDHFRIETRFAKTIINPLDESALELSLKFRDLSAGLGAETTLTALTLGNAAADPVLKTLAALKFDRLVRLASEEEIIFNPELVSERLCAFILKNKPYGLIIMGGRSADGDNAAVPFMVAEMLGLPCLNQVTGFSPSSGSAIEAKALTDDGELGLTVKLPLVMAIGNALSSYLRVPTLKDRMSHGKKELEIIPHGESTQPASQRLIALKYEENLRAGEIIHGDSPAAKAALIYERYLRGRL